MSFRDEKPFCPKCGSRAYKIKNFSNMYLCSNCALSGEAKFFSWGEEE